VRTERRLQTRERLECGPRPRLLVRGSQAPPLLGASHGDRNEILLDLAVGVRLCQPLLAGDRESVGPLLGQLGEAVVQILCRLSHHERGRIDQLLGDDPRIRIDTLAHGVVTHVLDPTRHDDVVRAKRDARGGCRDCRHRAGAHSIDRISGSGDRQSGQESRCPADGQPLVADLRGRRDGHVVDAVR
jgi:hypothetical protein